MSHTIRQSTLLARSAISIVASALAVAGMASLIGCKPSDEPEDAHETEAEHEKEFERGAHGGRLLRDGDFALELQISEEGAPPEFHVYLYRADKPVAPDSAAVSVELTRLDGEINRFQFSPHGEFLRGDGVAQEPHSFRVKIVAQEQGKSHRWTFDSFEGRTTIDAEQARAAEVRTERAGPAVIVDTLVLNGRLLPNAERTRSVSARFPGAIRQVLKSVGDSVQAGDRLATIESNESLQTYPVTAPIAGVITERHANAGEIAASDALFVIVDYRQLWGELSLFPRDLARVKVGQKVVVNAADGGLSGEGTIVRIAPAEGAQHGSLSGVYTARVALENAERRWSPGLFVEGHVQIGQSPVPLAVKRSALQAFQDFTVVFEQVGTTYEARMLELGRQDPTWAEVLGGLKPGAQYVTNNSYLIKADIEKSGASHDH